MSRDTRALALGQPAARPPHADFFADAKRLEEHGLAETALWIHGHLVGTPHGEYALQARLAAASLASRDRRRATPRTIQRRVARLVALGFFRLISKERGVSQVLTLGARYGQCRGPAYKTGAGRGPVSLAPHRDTVSASTVPIRVPTLGVRARTAGKTAGESRGRVVVSSLKIPRPCSTQGIAPRTHPPNGKAMKPPPSIESDEPQAATITRTPTPEPTGPFVLSYWIIEITNLYLDECERRRIAFSQSIKWRSREILSQIGKVGSPMDRIGIEHPAQLAQALRFEAEGGLPCYWETGGVLSPGCLRETVHWLRKRGEMLTLAECHREYDLRQW